MGPLGPLGPQILFFKKKANNGSKNRKSVAPSVAPTGGATGATDLKVIHIVTAKASFAQTH